MKNLVLLFLFISHCFCAGAFYNSWGKKGYPSVILVDADKIYSVVATIDTLVTIKNKSQRIHHDFELLYAWKGNYAVQFVVKRENKISKKEAEMQRTVNFFEGYSFSPGRIDCNCILCDSLPTQINYRDELFYTEHSKLGIYIEDSIQLYKFFYTNIYASDLNQSVFSFYSKKENYDNIFYQTKRYDKEASVINQIYSDLFRLKNGCLLLPVNLPLKYDVNMQKNYRKCCGKDVQLKIHPYNVNGNAKYNLHYRLNRTTCGEQYDEYRNIFYIPHAVFLVLPGSFPSAKITSINGLPVDHS